MEFNTLPNPMDRTYYALPQGYLGEFEQTNYKDIEKSIGMHEIGQSVAEGQRFGNFIQTAQNAIKAGAGKLELSTGMGGGQESVGSEAYGEEAREALREISKVNQTDFVSVHTPVQVANMSGYNAQERGFSDEHRRMGMEEVKKAIDFASDINGGAVVVHTGEYQRDISDQPWAKNRDGSFKFLNYDEEPGRAVLYMVDDRTGKLITEVRKSMVVHEPRFNQKYDSEQSRMRWIDKDEKFLDETKIEDLFRRVPEWDQEHTRFKTRQLAWDDFVERANTWNNIHPKENGYKWTPEEMFFRSQMETRILQARGSSLFHGRSYDKDHKAREELLKMFDYFKSIEDKIPIDEQWKIMEQQSKVQANIGFGAFMQQYGPKENKLPSEIIKEKIKDIELDMKFIHESSAAADAQAEETYETMQHVVPVEKYAKEQTSRGIAEAGIYAMERTRNNPHSEKDVFVAPENIFPEMGYGSHPEELISLVKDARKEMVKQLTQKTITDPHQRRGRDGNLIMINNPNYDPSVSESQAQKQANQHIKATLDTQHLGMWWKHFQPLPGESKQSRKERFDNWYMDQVKKLEDADIVGHIHVVDAMGGGHQHLPVGQGTLPIRKALEYLKSKGYGGTMISEAYGEDAMHGAGRILTETWKGLGTPIRGAGYRMGAPAQNWTDIQHGYFGATQNPYFIFGAYSPSNDWQLWSQVPME